MAYYNVDMKVRFADCDPAGIVFYPRYFEMVNAVVEDWFEDILHKSFKELHLDDGHGLPTVHLETNFIAASRIGDILHFKLGVLKIGTSSMKLEIIASCGKETRVTMTTTKALIDLKTSKPIPIPEKLKEKMMHFFVGGDEG